MLLDRPERERREAARARAECFGWGTAVDAFLTVHDAAVPVRPFSRAEGAA
jgi:alpha-1,6-mannosyltransferase